jgi:hypothetical protein
MKFNIKNKFTGALTLLMVVLMADSCKKGIFNDDINTNPAQLANPTPTLLLPGVISSTGFVWGGDASRFASLFMQQTTGIANQANSYSNYAVGTGDVDNMWTNLYGGTGGVMTNANQLITIAAKNNQLHYEAIGKIMMANALGLTTDMWGDVPYSQAFKGLANVDPTYDSQQSIYTSLDGLLNDAIAALGKTETTVQPGSDDLIYKGDLTKWVATAYALKAKFYLHLGKVDASNYGKAITAANTAIADGFNSAKSNFIVPFLGASSTSQGPWYQFNDQRGDIGFTGYIYDIMKAAGDPRETSAVYGDGGGSLGDLYGSQSSPVDLLTYDELLFIQAEAYFQTGDKQNAANAYNAAVVANLQRTVGNADYAAIVAKTVGNITLTDIMTQKYIALFLDPEVWTDWRRTGLPALTPNPQGNGGIPRSLLYPVSEVQNNTNTPANTTLAKRVYWDKQ